jgi:D-tyrosyl-tRNA(Tyr) deacylase
MQNVLKAFMHHKETLNLDYEVSFECTHHGPSLNVPTMFVELGSSFQQWSDLKGAEAVAYSAMTAIANFTAPTTSAYRHRQNPLQPRFALMAL